MKGDMKLLRLGTAPRDRDAACVACDNCPDLFELPDGSFAVIGRDATDELRSHLPPDAGCGGSERIVVIPRQVLVAARRDIPAVP